MINERELLKKIYDELKEIKYWIRLSSIPIFRRVVLENLKDDESKLVYELSDGERSTREIANELRKIGKKITHATVANMWKRWATTGIIEPSEKYQGRYKKIASLELLGINLSKVLKRGEHNAEQG